MCSQIKDYYGTATYTLTPHLCTLLFTLGLLVLLLEVGDVYLCRAYSEGGLHTLHGRSPRRLHQRRQVTKTVHSLRLDL